MSRRMTRQDTEKRAQASALTQMKTNNPHDRVAADRQDGHRSLPALIAMRAYEIYVQRGHREGCALEDWLEAEREILSRPKPG